MRNLLDDINDLRQGWVKGIDSLPLFHCLLTKNNQGKMMNKQTPLFIAMVASGAVFLSACGGDGTQKAPPPNAVESYEVGTHPRFDPIRSDLPFNTDIIFAKAAVSDGTADLGVPTDPVRHAVNQMDGFSVSAYFDVLIEGSVNPASALANRSVFLVELDAQNKDALDIKNVTGIKGVAEFDVVVASLDGGTNNAIRVRPLVPLNPKSKYLVILTNDLVDTAGKPLTRSWVYNSLRDPNYATAAGLAPLKPLLNGWETLASGFLAGASGGQLTPAAAKEKIILSYAFTTTDPKAVLVASAAPRAALVGQLMAAGQSLAEATQSAMTLDSHGLLSTPKPREHGISAMTGIDFGQFTSALTPDMGKLYTGYIKLPYYLTAAANTSDKEYITKAWQPNLALADQLGVTVPRDLDGSYNVTYRYPFIAPTSVETVPLQITLPNTSTVPGYAGEANCGQIYATSGLPTVMFIHGITADRSSVLALAHTLASKCVATVAIDLPLHGVAANSAFAGALNVSHSALLPFDTLYAENAPKERHFGIGGAAGNPQPMNFDAPTAADGSGAQFINLGHIANTRDNNRQAVMDFLNLNASLKNISESVNEILGVGLNYQSPFVVGSSLGGILGTTFVTVNQLAIAGDASVGLSSHLNPIAGFVASGSGSQVTQVLVNSGTYAPVINGGLAQSGISPNTTNYERFLYATQSLVDLADPVSYMETLKNLGVPVLLQQINGDAVVPNSATNAPLAGTQGLASLAGAQTLGLGQTNLTQSPRVGLVKVKEGGHASLLRVENDSPQATGELQAQVVTFILNRGAVAVGSMAPGIIDSE